MNKIQKEWNIATKIVYTVSTILHFWHLRMAGIKFIKNIRCSMSMQKFL